MGVTQKVGSLGEELAVKFLMKRGYNVLDRNYRRPWGELDIVVEREGKIHFIEVKALSGSVTEASVTHETSTGFNEREKALKYVRSNVKKDRFRAEDNVSTTKMRRLRRIIQTYLSSKHVSDETDWQFDVVTVYIDKVIRKAKLDFIENVIL